MPIEPLLPATRDYLHKLGVVAVAVSMTNRVVSDQQTHQRPALGDCATF
jgi:hypothetical protein